MNEKNIKIDRETKILLLQVLKQGYFTCEDYDLLQSKIEPNKPKTITGMIVCDSVNCIHTDKKVE
jgi:aspartate carbamoyltransferase regulatory subunit